MPDETLLPLMKDGTAEVNKVLAARQSATVNDNTPKRQHRMGGVKQLQIIKGGAANPDWIKDCQTNKDGKPIPNLANVLLALRSDPAWRDVVVFDEMRRCAILLKPIPQADRQAQPGGGFQQRPMTDADVTATQEWLQLSGLTRVTKDATHQGMDLYANEHGVHPVRDWLDGLKWDQTNRVKTWLSDFLGAKDDDAGYARSIGAMFLISMVARVMEPGCKVDYMLVLEGPQGIMKSSACKALAGEEWFSDNMPENVSSKDAALHCRGKWLIELAEMHALSKSETTALKGFLTRTVDVYRPPYGRLEVHERRQCSFIGSTNLGQYLKDETGGRRFWPVRCGRIKLERLIAMREQLFAEAVVLYRQGHRWWPDANFERAYIKPQQDKRFVADAWQDAVEDWLDRLTVKQTTVLEIARGALEFKNDRLGTADQRRIAAILEKIGWEHGQRSDGARWWIPRLTAVTE